MLALTFLLLTCAFRTIVLPAAAIALNLLSVGAAYGLLVLVFVDGFGRDLLGFTEVEVIAAWLPLFLFAVLFGLSKIFLRIHAMRESGSGLSCQSRWQAPPWSASASHLHQVATPAAALAAAVPVG